VNPLELLARIRTLLTSTRQEATPIPPQAPRDGTRGFASVRLELDRSDLDDLVREIDAAITGAPRDYFLDRESATRVVYGLQSQARDELLVDLLAARSAP
jgi:hypothetical protein